MFKTKENLKNALMILSVFIALRDTLLVVISPPAFIAFGVCCLINIFIVYAGFKLLDIIEEN